MSTDQTTPQPVDDEPGYAPAPAPVITGPAPFPILLGLFAIAVAVLTAIAASTDVRINWEIAGPAVIVGSGMVLALLGLLAMRRRD